MSEDQSGRVLNGRYELTLRIGEGTTGDVYRAWAPNNLHRYVAIKLLKPDVVARVGWEEAVTRFEREARSGAQLVSAHAVRVTDFDFDAEQGYPYIVMEHLEGVDLMTHLRRVGKLSVGETATVLEHVADVMAEAHAKGIVHRDLKPEHILLTGGSVHRQGHRLQHRQTIGPELGEDGGARDLVRDPARRRARYLAVHEPGAAAGRVGRSPDRHLGHGGHRVRVSDRNQSLPAGLVA